jgi:hypothetical protein
MRAAVLPSFGAPPVYRDHPEPVATDDGFSADNAARLWTTSEGAVADPVK